MLIKHGDRYDLPKGHIEPGESEIECALRELKEETGITKEQVFLDNGFKFETIYYPRYKRFGNQKVEKSLIIFLGRVEKQLDISTREHSDYEWIEWNSLHTIGNKNLDYLLSSLNVFLKS